MEEIDTKKRILIVDDEEHICRSLKLLFDHEGYETETVETGREALEKVKAKKFNLVLLDIKLPDMEGVELVTPLKELHPDIVVMMITGYASLETAVQSMRNGASAYIMKPLDMKEVLHAVREALERQYLIIERRRLFKELQRELAERKRMEKTLQESEERLRSFMDAVTDYIIICDPKLNIVEVNRAGWQAKGLKKEDMFGKNLFDIYPHLKELGRYDKYRRVIRTGEPLILEEIVPHPKFGDRHLTVKVFKVGEGLGMIIADITERKQAEEEIHRLNQFLESIIDNASVWLDVLDENANVVIWNKAAEKISGYSREEVVGHAKIWGWLYPEEAYRTTVLAKAATIIEGEEEDKGDETTIRCKDGQLKTIAWHSRNLVNEEGTPIGSIAIGRDVTDRKQAEMALRESEEKYRTILETIEEGYYEVDLAGNFTFFNDSLCRLFGYPANELMGMNNRQYMDEETAKAVYQTFNEVYRTGNPTKAFGWEIVRKDGTRRFVEASVSLQISSTGEPTGFRGIVRDITDRKQTEIALRESEERYRSLFEESPISLWEEDFSAVKQEIDRLRWAGISDFRTYFAQHPDMVTQYAGLVRILDVNKATLKLYNARSKNELLTSLSQVFCEETYGVFREELIALTKGEMFEGEAINQTLTGDKIHIRLRLSVAPGYEDTWAKVLVSISDITEQRRMAEALRESERTFRRTFEAIPDPAYLWKRQMDGRIILVAVNKAAFELSGGRITDFIGTELGSSNIPYYSYSGLGSTIKHVLTTGETLREEMRGRLRTTREERWFLADYAKTAEDSVLLITKDITTRKQAEETLARAKDHLTEQVAEKTRHLLEEKARVETIIETIPEGLLVFNKDGTLSLANKTVKEYYWNLFHEELHVGYNCLQRTDNSFLETVQKLFLAKTGEVITIEPKPGLHLQFISAVTQVPGEMPFGAIIEVRDISPFINFDNMRKRFVSSVSHELRTPISAIAQSINNIMKYKERLSEEQQDKLLGMISRNVKLMTQLIDDLLFISRMDEKRIEIERKQLRPLEVLQEVLTQLEPSRKAKAITVEVEVDENIELVGDHQKIGQIFRIFLDNALKYSDDQTRIKIEAIDHYQGPYNPEGRDGVLIHFHDSGRGIREKDLPYLFERFFRSEDVQEIPGTGLGLAIAQELTTLHQGEIFVKSEFGKGSTFSVFLPRLSES
ncbi:MAG: PAS domain S-box protein [Candidatus Heimdallarchaeota archaeon]